MHLFLVGHITTRLYRLHIIDPNSQMAVMSAFPGPQEMRKMIQLVSFPGSLRMATTFWSPENWNDARMSWLPSSWEVKGTLAMVCHLLCVIFLASEPGFITIYKFMVPNLAGRSCISAFITKHSTPPPPRPSDNKHPQETVIVEASFLYSGCMSSADLPVLRRATREDYGRPVPPVCFQMTLPATATRE